MSFPKTHRKVTGDLTVTGAGAADARTERREREREGGSVTSSKRDTQQDLL